MLITLNSFCFYPSFYLKVGQDKCVLHRDGYTINGVRVYCVCIDVEFK